MTGRLVVPTVEAGRGKIYAAQYGLVSGVLEGLEGPGVHDPSDLVEAIDEPAIFCGSGVKRCQEYVNNSGKDIINAGSFYEFPRAGILAELSYPRFQQLRLKEGEIMAPDYLMEPAAIIKRTS